MTYEEALAALKAINPDARVKASLNDFEEKEGRTDHMLKLFARALSDAPAWRMPTEEDQNQERLVRHPILVDEDFNPTGVVMATIDCYGHAVCAIWNNDQDCWDTRTLIPQAGFEVKEVPYE